MITPEIVLVPRRGIGELIDDCIAGRIKFSGPDSLCAKVHAMGYNTNSLYEMVMARRAQLEDER